MRVSGLEDATFVGFQLAGEPEALPTIWECPHCARVVVLYGAEVERHGFVTCLPCLRPMHMLPGTVH